MASVDTHNETGDADLRGPSFFDAEFYPTMTYRSPGPSARNDGYALAGELTLQGVTGPVALELEFNGAGPDPAGGGINRRDFGIDSTMPLDGGGVVVDDKVQISLEIEAVLQTATN